MSEAFKKRIKELKDKEKLTDFGYNQLVCLNSIMGSLGGIESYLAGISQSLSNIKDKGIDEDLIRGER